ncbi:MAG: hypothetical protein C0592_03990 [Marinilabiliales bacterium]|nr:MAG: hypothetical protein C0592_03990 [Marinilabiliales bacterium]
MKTTKKIVLFILIGLVVAIATVATYYYFKKSPTRPIWNYIPQDAVYIIETDNLTDGWNTLAESKMWRHLISDPLFEDINESAISLDSLIRDDETMDMLFIDRPLLISCHLLPENDFDFLFLVDLKEAGKFAFIKSYIKGIVDYYGYDMETEKYDGFDMLILTDQETGEVFYVSIIDNVFMASYNKGLIEKSYNSSLTPDYWKNNTAFQKVVSETSSSSLFRFYANFDYMAEYIGYYLSDQDELLDELKRIFNYSAFDIDFQNEEMTFKGATILKDSVSSYLHMLSEIEPGEMQAYRLIPDYMALYVSITFDDYMEFYEKLKQEFTFNDSANAESYSKTIEKVEKMFKISLEQDFFSWIGSEIAMVKLPPTSNSKENDMLAYIHTNDIELAETGLGKIVKQITKKTPIKNKEKEYKEITIHYFGLSGFFRMFFGKLFARLDKPYFIYLDDFVVFSNNPSTLMDVIDAWEKGKVLQNDEEYMRFMGNFEEEANVSIFLKGPKIYSHLYHFAQKGQKNGIQKSRELIVSFQNIGFQLISDEKGKFSNMLMVQHNLDALFEHELELIENSAEELFIDEFDSLLVIEYPEDAEDGKTCRIYWDDDSTDIKAEGRIRDGEQDGMWRYYYESGNIRGTIVFEEGKADGKAIVYYDEEEGGSMAQLEYDEGERDGYYREYYKNGERKCQIEFNKDVMDGKAEFYYDSGLLKIEGQYKEGVKKGKWKHYTETGDLFDKEKWRKGKKKDR